MKQRLLACNATETAIILSKLHVLFLLTILHSIEVTLALKTV